MCYLSRCYLCRFRFTIPEVIVRARRGPAAKTNAVDQQAQKLVTRLVTTSCRKEAAQVALHESTSGLQDAVVALSSRMIADQIKSQTKNTFSNSLLSAEQSEQLKEAGKVLQNLFQK